ncbi:MAG: AAA family ATPase [Deltaproteobacteria bacterium]|nr:AAA family ATPase [Deltaproteobacteria bacterium]
MCCGKCGSDNRRGRKFCTNCGTPLVATCPKCGAAIQPDEKFCGECGAAIGASAASTLSSVQPKPLQLSDAIATTEIIDGERKTVTALFADIKGSMELMENLDPEEARAIVDPALKLMIDAVRHYDGYVVQSTGDGIFALFGAPVAHEDHPQRALYAAVRMQEGMRHYNDRMRARGQAPIQVRIGVNTGEVVVRSIQTGDGHAEYTPIGHSTSLAARLQTLATPGSTVISGYTRRFVEGYFQLKTLGPTRVKGVSEPIDVFEVIGLSPLRTRLQVAARRGLTKLVGREREMDALKHAAALARTGHGQMVAVVAEPGTGKSRLFHEFKLISHPEWMVLEAFSISHGKGTAYLPVIELLHEYFAIEPGDDTRKRREKVGSRVLMLDRSLEDTLPYLLALLGLGEGDDELAQIGPQVRRRRMHEAIKRILLRESLNQPLMVIFEDLHWIDNETQSLLNLLVDSLATARILLLVNYRPEYRHDWGGRTYYTQLRLDPLGKEAAEEMLDVLLLMPFVRSSLSLSRNDGGRGEVRVVGESKHGDDSHVVNGADLATLKRLIIQRTEGNPFFMEETVQALLDDGALVRNGQVKITRPLAQLKIPLTVQATLAARIDRLPAAEKELLQILAVIGNEIALDQIKQVTGKGEEQLEPLLSNLQLSEFVYEQPGVEGTEYIFKHALTQEVAYNSLLAERRRMVHEQAARAIEALYGRQLEDHYSELARHYLRSNDAAKAVHYAQFAAEQAINRAAHTESTSMVQDALKLLDQLPNDTARLNAELALRNLESGIAFVVYGGASEERERAIRRMCIVGEMIGGKERLVSLMILSNLSFQRGEPIKGVELVRRFLSLAEATHDLGLMADAYLTAGLLAWSSGRFSEALSHFENSQQAGRIDRTSSWAMRLSLGSVAVPNETVIATVLTFPLHLLGRIDEAAKLAEYNLRQVRESRRLHDLVLVLTVTGEMFRYFRREPHDALAHADEALAISEENGLTYWLHRARFNRGWALAELGQASQGIADMESGMAGYRQIGGIPFRQFATARLAYTYAKTGQTEKGLVMLNDALEQSENTGEKVTQAEMLRLKGEILLMHDTEAVERAETSFRAALNVARTQEAKWWELRTYISLARLLRETNRHDEARTLLAEIYNWFTGGFELPDLQEAKTLLDELSC